MGPSWSSLMGSPLSTLREAVEVRGAGLAGWSEMARGVWGCSVLLLFMSLACMRVAKGPGDIRLFVQPVIESRVIRETYVTLLRVDRRVERSGSPRFTVHLVQSIVAVKNHRSTQRGTATMATAKKDRLAALKDARARGGRLQQFKACPQSAPRHPADRN